MNIEDLLEIAAGYSLLSTGTISVSSYHQKPIYDMALQTMGGKALTERQSSYIIAILRKYRNQFNTLLGKDIIPFLDSPKYRMAIRKFTNNKSVTTSPDGTTISVSFPYDVSIIEKIREYRNKLSSKSSLLYSPTDIHWNDNSWIFSVKEENIIFIANELLPLGFSADDAFIQRVEEIGEVEKNFEKYIPTLAHDGDTFVYRNVHTSVPMLYTNDLETALFKAKHAGITIWDDDIDTMISASAIDQLTMSIIKNDGGIISMPSSCPMTVLIPTLNHSVRCLFVIPGGSEYLCMKTCVDLMRTIGVSSREMSVLFRLPNKTNKEFNQYVKDNALNNPISESTRAAFIMGKLPKLLCEFDGEFDIIVTLGNSNPNYMLKNYIKNHHCVVNYSLTSVNKELNFDNL